MLAPCKYNLIYHAYPDTFSGHAKYMSLFLSHSNFGLLEYRMLSVGCTELFFCGVDNISRYGFTMEAIPLVPTMLIRSHGPEYVSITPS